LFVFGTDLNIHIIYLINLSYICIIPTSISLIKYAILNETIMDKKTYIDIITGGVCGVNTFKISYNNASTKHSQG
jgi:hypothetical protein